MTPHASSSQLAEVSAALDALTSAHSGNTSRTAWWRRIALAAEEAAGASTTANASTTGWMLRTAVALESVAGTSGAEENLNYAGLMKRIVDALEVQAGGSTTGSLSERLVNAAQAAEFEPEAISTQWRLYFTDGADSTLELGDVEMKSASGGSDLTTGGSASASSSDGGIYIPDNAFNASASYWRPLGGGNGNGSWLQYTFASAVNIIEITIAQNWYNTGPRIFDVQYHDGSSWVTSWTVTTGTWAADPLERRIFTKP